MRDACFEMSKRFEDKVIYSIFQSLERNQICGCGFKMKAKQEKSKKNKPNNFVYSMYKVYSKYRIYGDY